MRVTTPRRGSVALLAAGLWAISNPAAATVYRCGQTYQQAPCPGGQPVAVDDTRDATQIKEAQALAAKDERLAKTLASQRKEREKSVKPQARPAGIPVQPPFPASAPAGKPTTCKQRGKSHAYVPKCAGDNPVYIVPAQPATPPVKP